MKSQSMTHFREVEMGGTDIGAQASQSPLPLETNPQEGSQMLPVNVIRN